MQQLNTNDISKNVHTIKSISLYTHGVVIERLINSVNTKMFSITWWWRQAKEAHKCNFVIYNTTQ